MSPNMLEGLFSEGEEAPMDMPMEPSMSPEDSQKSAMGGFDLPVPGQSLTAPKGEMSFEQPPQYTDIEEAAEFLFDRMTSQENVTNLLRILNTGIPARMLIEPVLLSGAQEGLWNVDMTMALVEPMIAIMMGIAHMGGVKINLDSGKKENIIDTAPFEKMMAGTDVGAKKADIPEDIQGRKDALLKSIKSDAPKGLLARGAE